MLTGKSVLFVGGDARHLEMWEQLILAGRRCVCHRF